MSDKILNQVENNFLLKEKKLSLYATKSVDAVRLNDEAKDIRPAFFRDIDRIIHALSYTRYLNKTQVYSFEINDHVSKRMVHVQLVSKIARTIGRALNLNEDLIEAIALGHDIGHTPLGHFGESVLNEIAKEHLDEVFAHNLESVRNYMVLENHGEGMNLTVQVLDGIMCHNGELLLPQYKPCPKTKEEFLEEYKNCYKDEEILRKIRPMTLEGCVVRISDMIGYVGRDIEDAIQIGRLKRSDIPKEIVKTLGDNNRDIVNTLILDIINNSLGKDYIELSQEVFDALNNLKKFNYKYIYNKALTSEKKEYYRCCMHTLYHVYLEDIKQNNKESAIYLFLDEQNDNYHKNTRDEKKVLDFLAGMTDGFFLSQYEKIVKKSNSFG